MSDLAAEPAAPPAPSLFELFAAFLKIGVLGFGGVAAQARHVIVVERKLLSDRGFAELFGVSSSLPGANTVNMATLLGDRHAGLPGVAATVGGLLGAPLVILVAVATLYTRYADLPLLRAALSGAAAAAAGLVVGTALKTLKGLEADSVTYATTALVCVAAAYARLPMLATLAIAIPASLGLAILRRSRGTP